MSELSPRLTEWLAEVIPQEAGAVYRSYRLVPLEDVEQQMWLTAVKRAESFERLTEQGAYGVARKRLKEGAWKLVKEDDRYRRAVKAARAGYRPADEQFYTIGVLKRIIPMYLDNGVTERPPQGREQPKVSGGAEGSGSDFMAMMLDLDMAWKHIKSYHGSILSRYYEFPQGQGGYTHLEIAGRLGIPPEALRARINRALRAVQRQLGGRNPWNRRALEYQDAKDAA